MRRIVVAVPVTDPDPFVPALQLSATVRRRRTDNREALTTSIAGWNACTIAP
jgi:hypothetical protein